ncbi:PCC domain-containing protein [Streptomyces sp. SD15]
MLTIDVGKGEEVLGRVKEELALRGIAKGAIVSVIGAVDRCEVSTMPKNDASSDIIRSYADPLEMFGTGEVRDGIPHIHAVFGTEDGTAVSGHLHAATVGHWFVRVYVIPDQ